jgi:hypothetical protein
MDEAGRSIPDKKIGRLLRLSIGSSPTFGLRITIKLFSAQALPSASGFYQNLGSKRRGVPL